MERTRINRILERRAKLGIGVKRGKKGKPEDPPAPPAAAAADQGGTTTAPAGDPRLSARRRTRHDGARPV